MKNKTNLIVVFILFLGFIVRFYNFENRLIFGPEQAISFLTSAGNLEKFSLLGETNLQRATSAGHIPFHGAYYSYLILPVLLIFQYKVLPVTFIFLLFNLLTALYFYKVISKYFGPLIGLFSLFFFTFSAVMIHHSLFAWILNPLPLLGILSLDLLFRLYKNRSDLVYPLLIGITGTFGFGLQNLYLPFAFILYLIILTVSKNRFKTFLLLILGSLLGALPTVLFDLKHDFYHTRTYVQYFIDVFVNHTVSGFTDYYHFLYLFPLKYLFYALVVFLLFKLHKLLPIFPLIFYLYLNLSPSNFINYSASTGMPKNLTLQTLETAAKAIYLNNPPAKFNVVTLWDFDTRAHPLRYLLKYYYDKTAQPVEQYADNDALYVFASSSYNMENPQVWELKTFLPYKSQVLSTNTPGYILYKLIK